MPSCFRGTLPSGTKHPHAGGGTVSPPRCLPLLPQDVLKPLPPRYVLSLFSGAPSLPVPKPCVLCAPRLPLLPPHTQECCSRRGLAGACVPHPSSLSLCLFAGPGGQTLCIDRSPPSVSVIVGEEARLPCLHNISRLGSRPNVTWWRIIHGNFTWPTQVHDWVQSNGELTISSVNKNHRGLYRCHVLGKRTEWHSCGTYLRVRGECQGRWASCLGSGEGASACLSGIWLLAPIHLPVSHLQSGGFLGALLGAGLGGTGPGARALSSTPSSQSQLPDPSWTWGRAPRTTSSPRRESSCSSARWCPGHCCCSG